MRAECRLIQAGSSGRKWGSNPQQPDMWPSAQPFRRSCPRKKTRSVRYRESRCAVHTSKVYREGETPQSEAQDPVRLLDNLLPAWRLVQRRYEPLISEHTKSLRTIARMHVRLARPTHESTLAFSAGEVGRRTSGLEAYPLTLQVFGVGGGERSGGYVEDGRVGSTTVL